MKTEEYAPRPVDTSGVTLPDELAPLAEALAKNVHEVWSATRIRQGWTYGPNRDDASKRHPCLVPYEQLSEEEKTFDRKTSTETLKLILKLGFRISQDRLFASDFDRLGNEEPALDFND